MAHPRNRMRPGEQVILDVRPHWWYFARPALLLGGSILIAIVVLITTSNSTSVTSDSTLPQDTQEAFDVMFDAGPAIGQSGNSLVNIIRVLSAGLIVLTIGIMIISALSWYFTHFFVSTDRIVNRSGVLNRQGVEIPIERVNTVFFEQNFLERLVGAGDVLVESAGESGAQRFFDIGNPLIVQERIQQQLQKIREKHMTPKQAPAPSKSPTNVPTPTTSGDIPEQIQDLYDLRKRGVLTEEEFSQKKAELLSRM